MTLGQILFYSGAALLGITVILAIIFIIKKPKYTPESAAYDISSLGRTQRLLNGYPTDPLTVRRQAAGKGPETQKLAVETVPLAQETEKLAVETVPLAQGTEKLAAETVPLAQGTEKLAAETVLLGQETQPLQPQLEAAETQALPPESSSPEKR